MNKNYVIGISIALFVIWVLVPLILQKIYGSSNLSIAVSRFYNAVSPIFSGAALVGVVYTLQRSISESKIRDEQFILSQKNVQREINSAILATQLQTTKTLIDNYRSSMKDLRPNINLPFAKSKLISLISCTQKINQNRIQ